MAAPVRRAHAARRPRAELALVELVLGRHLEHLDREAAAVVREALLVLEDRLAALGARALPPHRRAREEGARQELAERDAIAVDVRSESGRLLVERQRPLAHLARPVVDVPPLEARGAAHAASRLIPQPIDGAGGACILRTAECFSRAAYGCGGGRWRVWVRLIVVSSAAAAAADAHSHAVRHGDAAGPVGRREEVVFRLGGVDARLQMDERRADRLCARLLQRREH
mmetsp:Transcript_39033/g.91300  ORF Transcript_39033/g.91300 Transcript_39033/m.91300 type:complete len:227 (-) Transcript_39033:1204-1884(-)